MLKNLTYRQKNKYLIVGTILFLLLVYWTTLSKTVELYHSNQRLQKQSNLVADAPAKIKQYERQIQQFEQRFQNVTQSGNDYQEQLLEVVSTFCQEHQLVLQNFPQPLVHTQNDFEVTTHIVEVEGSYHKLLQLVYELEQAQKLSRVASLDFRIEKDFRNKRSFLLATIYLRNIKSLEKNG